MRLSAILALCVAIGAATAGPAAAQTKTLPYDHIHLNVPDPAAASAWYEKNVPGARRITEMPDRLMYGSTRLMFLPNKNAVEPSAGSAVDHLGFSVKDLDATLKAMEGAGVKITSPARDLPGIFKIAFIEDPWGTRIELVQDAELLGLHHIHMRGPDVEEVFKWLLGNFGGERARMKDKLDGVRYSASGFSTVWILVQKGEADPDARQGDRSHRLAIGNEPHRHDQRAQGERCNRHQRAAAAEAPERPADQLRLRRRTERRAHRARRAAGAEAGRVRHA